MIKVTGKHETEFLFIPLPKTAQNVLADCIDGSAVLHYHFFDPASTDGKPTAATLKLAAFQKLDLIACTDTITEEQADNIVHKLRYVTGKPYRNYVPGDNERFWKALDSFVSMMKANRLSGKYAILRESEKD